MVGANMVVVVWWAQTSVKFREFEKLHLRKFATNQFQTW